MCSERIIYSVRVTYAPLLCFPRLKFVKFSIHATYSIHACMFSSLFCLISRFSPYIYIYIYIIHKRRATRERSRWKIRGHRSTGKGRSERETTSGLYGLSSEIAFGSDDYLDCSPYKSYLHARRIPNRPKR